MGSQEFLRCKGLGCLLIGWYDEDLCWWYWYAWEGGKDTRRLIPTLEFHESRSVMNSFVIIIIIVYRGWPPAGTKEKERDPLSNIWSKIGIRNRASIDLCLLLSLWDQLNWDRTRLLSGLKCKCTRWNGICPVFALFPRFVLYESWYIIPSSVVVVLPQAPIPVQATGHVLGTGKTKTNFLGIYSIPPVPPRLAYYVVERRRLRSIHPFDEWSVSGGCCCGASSLFYIPLECSFYIARSQSVCVSMCVVSINHS